MNSNAMLTDDTMHDLATTVPARILLVDDDAVFGMVTVKRLTAAGFDVQHITDSQNAYAVMSQSQFDLIVVDLSMPKLDGMDLIGSLRNADSTKELPIIVVTGSTSAGDLRAAIGFDVSWYINKPVNWPLFLDQIEQTLLENNIPAEKM